MIFFISPKQIAHSSCGAFSLLGVGVLELEELDVVEEEEEEEEDLDSFTPVISNSSGSMGEGGSRGSGEEDPPNILRKCARRDSN